MSKKPDTKDVARKSQPQDNLLQITEERLRYILEAMEDVYFESDAQGNFTFVNRSFCRSLGYSRTELLGMNFRALSTPETLNKLAEIQQNINASGERQTTIVADVIRKDKGRRSMEFSVSVKCGPAGKSDGFKGIGRDVTEKYRAVRSIQDSEERYKLLADNLTDVIWVLDDKMKYVYVSPSVMRLRGYTPEEVMKQPLHQTLTPESYQMAVDFFTRENLLEQSGQKHGREWVTYLQLEMRRKDGSTVWTEVHLNILYDEAGEAFGILGVTRDITERKKAEEALKKSEELYRTIFEHTATANMIVAEDTTILMVNSNFEKLIGFSRKKVENKIPWTRFICDEDVECMKERHNIRRSDPSAAPNTYEFKGVIQSGEIRHFFMSVAMIPGTRNSIASLIDITNRTHAEEELRKSQAQLSAFLNFIPALVLIKDHELRPVYANQKYVSLFPFDEWKGKKPEETFEPAIADSMIKNDRDAMENGHVQYEENWTDVTGLNHVFQTDKFRITVPGANPLLGVIITDITERKKAEEALRDSEERFRDMARLMPETLFEADLTGRFTFVNEAAFQLFGYSPWDVEKGLNVLDVMAPENHDQVIKNYQRIVKGERLGLSEYVARRKDGSLFPVLIHTTCVYKNGKPDGLRGFLIDISEKKAMENQLLRAQKMEAIGTLAGGIAHDFNNLLMGILGNLSLMLMDMSASHPFYDQIKSMEKYVQRGADLTRQLLGFAQGGKYQVRSTNLIKFTRQSAELFGRAKKDISIHFETSDEVWHVNVDRGQMDQVLLNLFMNAWQSMPGGGDLTVSLENANLTDEEVFSYNVAAGRYVKLTVRDTGIGMDEATQSRIFEPFFTTKERGHGTGLGLASVYGIIKNHSGFIRVQSEKGIGTSFMIYLPASDETIETDLHKDNIIHKGRETILFIDDEEMIADVGQQMLENLGYKVQVARGGREATALFEQNINEIDLVILDMIMPDMNGRETFEALRRLKPTVKVLLSSGYSLDSQAKSMMSEGCKGFIPKPFSTAELSKKVRDALASD